MRTRVIIASVAAGLVLVSGAAHACSSKMCQLTYMRLAKMERLATVEGKAITRWDMAQQLLHSTPVSMDHSEDFVAVPGASLEPLPAAFARLVVDQIIEERLLEREAARRGVVITNKQIAQRKKAILAKPENKFHLVSAHVGFGEEQFRRSIKAAMITEALFAQVTKDARLAPGALERLPRERAQVVVVTARDRALASAIRDRAKAGQPLFDAAQGTAAVRLRYRPLEPRQLDPALDAVVWDLSEKEVAGLYETPTGWALVQIEEGDPLAGDKGRAWALDRQREALFRDFVASLWRKADVRYRQDLADARIGDGAVRVAQVRVLAQESATTAIAR